MTMTCFDLRGEANWQVCQKGNVQPTTETSVTARVYEHGREHLPNVHGSASERIGVEKAPVSGGG